MDRDSFWSVRLCTAVDSTNVLSKLPFFFYPEEWARTFFLNVGTCTPDYRALWWRSLLKHCATSRKAAGLIPDRVIGILQWLSPSGPGVDSSSDINYHEYFLGEKAACAQGWQLYHFHVWLSWNLGASTSWNPSRPVQACAEIVLPFTERYMNNLSCLLPE